MDRKEGLLDWAVLIGLILCWGSAFAALRIAVQDIHPLWNTAIRLVVASVALGLGMLALRQPLPPLKDPVWRWYALSGVVGMAIPFALFAYASVELPSGVTAICNGGTPIFVAALAHLLGDEKMSGRKAGGVLLGFAGLAVLVGADAVRDVETRHTPFLLLALGGAALYAVSSVAIRRAPAVPALTGALLVCFTGMLLAVPLAAVAAPPPLEAPWRAWAAAVFLGLAPSAGAMIAWVWLLKRRGAVFASMGTYGAPLVAMAVGVLFLQEEPGPGAFAALTMVVSGVLLANLSAFRRQPKA